MNNEDICLEVFSNEPPPPGKEGYTIEIIWKSTSFTRMKNGLKRFTRRPDCISG